MHSNINELCSSLNNRVASRLSTRYMHLQEVATSKRLSGHGRTGYCRSAVRKPNSRTGKKDRLFRAAAGRGRPRVRASVSPDRAPWESRLYCACRLASRHRQTGLMAGGGLKRNNLILFQEFFRVDDTNSRLVGSVFDQSVADLREHLTRWRYRPCAEFSAGVIWEL